MLSIFGSLHFKQSDKIQHVSLPGGI